MWRKVAQFAHASHRNKVTKSDKMCIYRQVLLFYSDHVGKAVVIYIYSYSIITLWFIEWIHTPYNFYPQCDEGASKILNVNIRCSILLTTKEGMRMGIQMYGCEYKICGVKFNVEPTGKTLNGAHALNQYEKFEDKCRYSALLLWYTHMFLVWYTHIFNMRVPSLIWLYSKDLFTDFLCPLLVIEFWDKSSQK